MAVTGRHQRQPRTAQRREPLYRSQPLYSGIVIGVVETPVLNQLVEYM